MNYEQKYNEILEWARKNKARLNGLPIEEVLPELAESKDERIRRKMIEHFKAKTKETWCNIPVKDIIAYLEKQKECVSNNFDDVWAEEDCEEIIAEGQKLTPRFKELLKEVCHAWYDRGAKLEKQKSGLSFVGDFQAKTLQGPIELAEWKEAAKIREWILAKMQELAATGVPCSDEIKMADKAIDYLIKQKEYIEEPKIAFRDWGDKEKKEAIITCLKYMRFIKKITNQEYDDLIKWLANNTISNVSEKEECLREEKQKEQKVSVDDFKAKDWYVSKVDGKIHNIYYSVDKVKPKFKVGDKIIEKDFDECGRGTIIDIKDGKYIFDDGGFICIEEQGLWKLVEQKPAEWSELQSEFKNINEAFENGKKEVLTHPKKYGLCEQKPVDYDAELKKCKDNPLYFYDKYVSIKQKPAEWSEEDEERLKAICTYLQDYPRLAKINDVKRFNEYCDWLKSLPLNLKKKNEDVAKLCSNEWSEEDETALGDLMWCIEQARKSAKDENDMGNIWFAENWVKNRLKSLRPRYHGDVTMTEAYKMGKEAGEASSWKPSEEDLMMLEHIIGQYETGNKNSKVMGYLPRIEELDFLKKVLAKWKN